MKSKYLIGISLFWLGTFVCVSSIVVSIALQGIIIDCVSPVLAYHGYKVAYRGYDLKGWTVSALMLYVLLGVALIAVLFRNTNLANWSMLSITVQVAVVFIVFIIVWSVVNVILIILSSRVRRS